MQFYFFFPFFLSTPLYAWPMLTVCALLYVVTGVQFWGTLFFSSTLHLSPSAAVLTFAAVAATSPVAGVVMGGLTVDALGGYKTTVGRKRTLDACAAYAAAAVFSGTHRFSFHGLSRLLALVPHMS